LWCALDPTARLRAAEHPMLLLDMNFSDAVWWGSAAQGRSVEETTSVASYLPAIIASELTRETLTVAWTLARADPGIATVLCGMAPQVSRLFASFSPAQLERLSAREDHLRLRFDDHPPYWRMHLKTAVRTSALSIEETPEDPQQSLF
jgi:hypothetical protein